eukprot:11244936-Alexandrium_andersonii.AAC.1
MPFVLRVRWQSIFLPRWPLSGHTPRANQDELHTITVHMMLAELDELGSPLFARWVDAEKM